MNEHFIDKTTTFQEAIRKLDELGIDALLFVVESNLKLIGSLTDGDVRRAFLSGVSINDNVETAMNKDPKFIHQNKIDVVRIKKYREQNLRIIPVVNDSLIIVDLLNFRLNNTLLPLDAIIMAGGKGERLRPLTENTPKPLLRVGDKPILEHNIDRLIKFGIQNIHISTNYLSQKIEDFVSDKNKKINQKINCVKEETEMGTIGSLSLIEDVKNEFILVVNSDLLSNIDFEDFFIDFLNSESELSVLSIPYKIDVPYAIMTVQNGLLKDLHEKPSYTYFSNGGVYLLKSSILELIPKNKFFLATDLLNLMIDQNRKVRVYEHHGYWLDIGKHDDFIRAQSEIYQIKL
jgi:dTDP-glucose pyrophosphorylase